MKICVVANSAWNLANFRLGFIKALLARGWQVHVLVPDGPETSCFLEAGCTVHALPMDCKGTHPWHDFQLFWRLRQIYQHLQPDAVVHYTIKPVIYGSLAARTVGIPVLNAITGLGTAFLRHGWLQRLVRQLYKLALPASPSVMFENPDDLALFVQAELLKPQQAVQVPGPGVDIQHFQLAPFSDAQGDSPIFLLVGRMLRDKGVVEFVEAARLLRQRYPAARFALLGFLGVENVSAISPAEMDEWVTQGHVEYWGSASDVRPMIARADCVVLPSYREGLPRTLLEAAAMGRPLVATDVPGCREVVVDGVNGYLCTAKDAEALAQAMEKVACSTPEQRYAMGLAGRRRVEEKFAESHVIKFYIQAILDMVK